MSQTNNNENDLKQNALDNNNYANNKELKVSTICSLTGLENMSIMNGKKVRIIGPFVEDEQRYPVFVYDTKDIVLIKPCNLKPYNLISKSQKEQIREILNFSNMNKRENMASRFANKMMKSNYNQLNTNLMQDFKKVLQGNCIYIPYFLCKSNDFRLLTHLKNDIKNNEENNGGNNNGMIDWSKHLKHENPSFSITFNTILEYMSLYFDMEIYASRLNYYRNGQDWKPYHHDSHAYCKNMNDKEDFTVGVSFGQERILSFIHVKTNQIFNIPQRNGDCFAFNSIVNSKFKHGVLKGNKSNEERFSIIAWGKRKVLNDKNSGINERNNNKVFTKRQII